MAEQCNVWIINLEDPMEEMQRRVLAAMKHYRIGADEVRGRLFVDAGRDIQIKFAVQTRNGIMPNKDLAAFMAEKIKAHKIGLVIIDPFVGAHEVNENDNMAINAVLAEIRDVADKADCAISIVHHVRKGNGEDINIDSVRGAGSLVGAVRAARVINRIPAKDAEALGIAPKEAALIFRVDDGKANLAPPAERSLYRQMVGVQIANGEWVGVAAPFELPDGWAGMSENVVNEMLRRIAAGPPRDTESEEYYSARPQDKSRWVGNVIMEFEFADQDHVKTVGQAKTIVKQWFATGLLEEIEYYSATQRKDRRGVAAIGRVGAAE